MKRHEPLVRLLRWYPQGWRARYGEEFLTHLEDRLEGRAPTLRFRTSVALAGLRERSTSSGVVGARSPLATQRRTGALIVLVAWSIMAIGGASIAKISEHYSSALPASSRAPAQFAYGVVTVAGVIGSLLVAAGGALAVPALVRFLRTNGHTRVLKTVSVPLFVTGTLIAATLGLSAWAHGLSSAQRNGSDPTYSTAFLFFGLLVVLTVALWTRAGVDVVSRIELSSRVLLCETYLAVGVCCATLAVTVSSALWWLQMGRHAPSFFASGAGGSASPWAPNLELTLLAMLLGAALALWGVSRIALTHRHLGASRRDDLVGGEG